MTRIIVMIMGLLRGTMALNNARNREKRFTESYYLQDGIHQNGGIGVCQKMRKKSMEKLWKDK